MRTHNIAVIPADGIGKEVIPAGVRVLQEIADRDGSFRFEFKTFPWGSDYYHEHGQMMPSDGLETLRAFDAIRITSYNVCYTKLLRRRPSRFPGERGLPRG